MTENRPSKQANVFLSTDQLSQAASKVCLDHGKDPASVHVDASEDTNGLTFRISLPREVQLAVALEERVGRGDGIRRKRDPMARFEIDVGDEEVRSAYRIVGAPQDLVQALFTPNVLSWIRCNQASICVRNGRELERHFAPKVLAALEEIRDSLASCEIALTVHSAPTDSDSVREYVSEIIAIERQLIGLAGGSSFPNNRSAGEVYRGTKGIPNPVEETARRQYELEAYFNAKNQPQSLSGGDLRQLLLLALSALFVGALLYVHCQQS